MTMTQVLLVGSGATVGAGTVLARRQLGRVAVVLLVIGLACFAAAVIEFR